jgi:nucleotide-binding universal stress UspA family protein
MRQELAMSIRSVLCPIDFSACSEEALRYAVSFAERAGASDVHLVHVLQPPLSLLPSGDPISGPNAEERARVARELESEAKRYSVHGVAVTPHLVDGVPYETIAHLAESLGVDLIVIGTHGRHGVMHALLGSVAERVVRLSPVPVCVVPKAK